VHLGQLQAAGGSEKSEKSLILCQPRGWQRIPRTNRGGKIALSHLVNFGLSQRDADGPVPDDLLTEYRTECVNSSERPEAQQYQQELSPDTKEILERIMRN